MTKRTLKSSLFALLTAGLLFAGQAQAFLLSFDPVTQNVPLGSPVSVDIVISELGDMVAPSLGGFDLDVNFDSAILDPSSIVFGNFLDLFLFGSIQDDISSTPGIWNAFEVSLESVADLVDLQPDEFVLFTLTFDTIGPGTSALTFSNVNLADENGALFENETDRVSTGSITVIRDGVVPEPATLALMGLGMAGFGFARRRKK